MKQINNFNEIGLVYTRMSAIIASNEYKNMAANTYIQNIPNFSSINTPWYLYVLNIERAKLVCIDSSRDNPLNASRGSLLPIVISSSFNYEVSYCIKSLHVRKIYINVFSRINSSYIRDALFNISHQEAVSVVKEFSNNFEILYEYPGNSPQKDQETPIDEDKESSGYVYILTNKGQSFIKIGMTYKHPRHRANELSNTSVPYRYELFYYVRVENYKGLERCMHNYLASDKLNKEFFNTNKYVAKNIMREQSLKFGLIADSEENLDLQSK